MVDAVNNAINDAVGSVKGAVGSIADIPSPPTVPPTTTTPDAVIAPTPTNASVADIDTEKTNESAPWFNFNQQNLQIVGITVAVIGIAVRLLTYKRG